MNSKENQVFNLLLIEYILPKKSTKQKEKGAYGLSPGWKVVCIQVPSIYLRSGWLMIKKNFVDT